MLKQSAPALAVVDGGARDGLPARAGAEAEALARHIGVSVTLADLLCRRGFSERSEITRFLEPKLADLTPPHAMADREVAAERIAFAIRERETVAVFGDYDCDGITSCAIMTSVIDALGGRAVPTLASRFDGGYGVSPAALERIFACNPRLLVTCDCGSSDHESLAKVAARGIDVIVIDHHLVPDEPLPALAFLNPHRPECGFPYKGLASCGLALSIAAAVRAKLGAKIDLRAWLDLVAIGTIADVAPLDGDNRALVRAGLGALGRAERPGVRALLELLRFDATRRITGEDIAFRIAPRLNSPGRLARPDLALELLLSKSIDEARARATEIEQRSDERRAIQDRMLAEAVREIEDSGADQRSALVIGREGWSHGIVGIVAGRLASRYDKPVIVVGFENGHGRGSVRGPKGARLYDALSQVSDVLVRFGGHQAAAGVELRLERLEELSARFEAACEAVLAESGPARPGPELDGGVWLHPADHPAAVLTDLGRLEPCGHGNPSPRILVEAEVVLAKQVKGGHLKLELELATGQRVGAFGVSMGERAPAIAGRVIAVGQLRHDAWRGGDAVEIRLDDVLDP